MRKFYIVGLLAAALGLLAAGAHADTYGPTISILSPSDQKTVWSNDSASYPVRIVFKAWDSDDVNTSSFTIRVDGNIVAGPSAMSNWGPPDANKTYHRYYDWNPSGYLAGLHTIQVSASDGLAQAGSSKKITINLRKTSLSNYSTFPGDGNLLVRDNDNTMCMACHALKSHSSADMGSTLYGNWERVCRDCHTPHNTRNIFILASSFKIYTGTNQTYSYNRKVDFRNLSGESRYGFVTKTGSGRRGPCEVCHTKTKNSNGTPRWRNWTSQPDADGVKHMTNTVCIDCHKHSEGFRGGDCASCHFSGSDLDDFVYNNATRARISQRQWTSVGHGRRTGSYGKSGNSGANLVCDGCHANSVSHGVTNNPFRLFTSDANALCWNCHGTAPYLGRWAPATAAKTAIMHHASSIVKGNNDFDAKCVDCHDPHGDDNIFMVHSTVSLPSAANSYTPSNQYGVPNGTLNNVDFTNNASGTDYATTAAVNGNTKICNVCHTRTVNSSTLASRYQRDMQGETSDSHNPTSKCTTCHKHDGGFKGAADVCSDCHTSANLSAKHTKHTNPDAFLTGKSIAKGSWGNFTTGGWYNYSSVGGTYYMGCGNCHPQDAATYHMNGVVNISLNKNDPGTTGFMKERNAATESYSQSQGISVTCSSAYCHSNGAGTYVASPDWFGAAPTDTCGHCHSNQPTTNAHGAHVVGIHYDTVFKGTTGLMAAAGASGAAHGNAATATTISCNLCHNATVTTSANDKNTVCDNCHGSTAGLQGNAAIAAGSLKHINGTPDVSFASVAVKSRAQVYGNISVVTELGNNWQRNNGFKASANSNDSSRAALSSASYAGGTCSSVVCHNSNSVTWTDTTVSCKNCHTGLPIE